MSVAALPSVFIASSSAGLPVAYDLQETLESDYHATVWKQGVFEPSRSMLADLFVVSWPHAATLLAPPDIADDFWDPAPRIAELYPRWR